MTSTAPAAPPDRLAELRDNLAAVRSRIEAGCAAAGRSATEITLIAVTKFFPVTDVALLAQLGVGDVGESRDQDASVKAAQLAEHTGLPVPVALHRTAADQQGPLGGPLRRPGAQRRPAGPGGCAGRRGPAGRSPALDVLVQLSLDEVADPALQPAAAAGRPTTCCGWPTGSPAPTCCGWPASWPSPRSAATRTGRSSRLAEVAQRLRADHPQAAVVSAGMSEDLEAALRHGATHVRIGTALLGRREPQFG